MPLLILVIILVLLMIASCIINCLTCFVSAQVNKLQHAMPVQQGYMKLHPATENITHPQMDTTIKTLRLGNGKRGRPNSPHHPSSAGSSQRNLNVPTPKEVYFYLLRGGMLNSQTRKKEFKMVVDKRQRKEKPTKMEQRKVPGLE